MRDLWNQIRQLWKEIGIVRQILERINVQWRMPRVRDTYIIVMGGNELDTGQDGCLWVSSVTELDADYDPNTATSFMDGIARGRLFVDGVEQADKVLIVNEGYTYGHALLGEDADDGPDKVWAFTATSKPIAAGGSKTVYRVG